MAGTTAWAGKPKPQASCSNGGDDRLLPGAHQPRLAYSLVSKRLDRTIVTAPIAFTLAGALIEVVVPRSPGLTIDPELILRLAEASLVLLLFTDAARNDPSLLWNMRELPARTLGIALPLNILAGAVVAQAGARANRS